MGGKKSYLKQRLNMLLLVCLIPLTVMIVYLLFLINRFSAQYDGIVTNITGANAYNLTFKEDMDYLMYIIAVNAERAEELVDTERPYLMIDEAREDFGELYDRADADYARNCLNGILKSLNSLEDRVREIEEDALVSGSYDRNMERLGQAADNENVAEVSAVAHKMIPLFIMLEASEIVGLLRNLEASSGTSFSEKLRIEVQQVLEQIEKLLECVPL